MSYDTTYSLFRAAAAMLAVTLVGAVVALVAGRGESMSRRLFLPGHSHLGEVIHVLSFFTFTDPGEVNWHAVDQAQERKGSRRLRTSLAIYLVLVLPSALIVDGLLRARGLRVTLAAALFGPPWLLIRFLEERARG